MRWTVLFTGQRVLNFLFSISVPKGTHTCSYDSVSSAYLKTKRRLEAMERRVSELQKEIRQLDAAPIR
jgi:hypothetical protein